jgi:hypothetical protein
MITEEFIYQRLWLYRRGAENTGLTDTRTGQSVKEQKTLKQGQLQKDRLPALRDQFLLTSPTYFATFPTWLSWAFKI